MAHVIIDTSVWIDYFHGALSPALKDVVMDLILSRQAAITDVIRHELLVGTTSEREYEKMEGRLSPLLEFQMQTVFSQELNRFGFELNRMRLLGGYADVTIAFLGKKFEAPIFSFDRYFKKLAAKKVISTVE